MNSAEEHRQEILAKIASRTSSENAGRIVEALGQQGLIPHLHFLKDGGSTSVFSVDDSNLIFKVSANTKPDIPRVRLSRYTLRSYCSQTMKDDSTPRRETVLDLEPALTHDGVTRLHQEMLRYKLWTEEGLDFWDILPARSNPKEIKNTMLDRNGVPYQVDKDAVMPFRDIGNSYPPDGNGKRTDEQYLDYRANQLDEHGRPDALPTERFRQIKEACAKCDWPLNQAKKFNEQVDINTVKLFKRAFVSLQGPSAAASIV